MPRSTGLGHSVSPDVAQLARGWNESSERYPGPRSSPIIGQLLVDRDLHSTSPKFGQEVRPRRPISYVNATSALSPGLEVWRAPRWQSG